MFFDSVREAPSKEVYKMMVTCWRSYSSMISLLVLYLVILSHHRAIVSAAEKPVNTELKEEDIQKYSGLCKLDNAWLSDIVIKTPCKSNYIAEDPKDPKVVWDVKKTSNPDLFIIKIKMKDPKNMMISVVIAALAINGKFFGNFDLSPCKIEGQESNKKTASCEPQVNKTYT